ncbi:MAG: hypothetical protein WC428_06650 [Candidatus Paceibacterota bacterium]|jgi:hypothetical protein
MDHLTNSFAFAGTVYVGTVRLPFAKAPADANGGGFTVTETWIVSDVALAAGSAPGFALVTLASGTSQTPTGTICSIAGSGAWTAGTTRTGFATVSDGWVDGGEYVALEYIGTAVNATAFNVTGGFNAVMGK